MSLYFFVGVLALLSVATAFALLPFRRLTRSSQLQMADVEITFPNKKKVNAAVGSAMKDAAAKAKYSPNYGCEEGKCGSCELKYAGKKIRPCIAKVGLCNYAFDAMKVFCSCSEDEMYFICFFSGA